MRGVDIVERIGTLILEICVRSSWIVMSPEEWRSYFALNRLSWIIPSFHAALGVLLIWAVWPERALRWISVVLNVTMIAATPFLGAHYLVDVIAGLCIASISIRITTIIARRIDIREGVSAPGPTAAILVS